MGQRSPARADVRAAGPGPAESFSRLSVLYDTRAGGTVLTVTGEGFTASSTDQGGPALSVAYDCLFLTEAEAAGTAASLDPADVARRTVRAALVGHAALTCTTPRWASNATARLDACPASSFASTAVFRLRKSLYASGGGGGGAAAASRNVTVSRSTSDYFLFQFLGAVLDDQAHPRFAQFTSY